MRKIFKNKSLCISFTGHRPNKLGGYKWDSPKNKRIMLAILSKLEEIILKKKCKKVKFIVGGALGADQMAFHVCYYLRQKYPNIEIDLAEPVKNMTKAWISKEDIKRYENQKIAADKVIKVYELKDYKNRNKNPYQNRNEYMVDKCDLLISIYDEWSKGGTKNCIDYAKKVNKEIININPDYV